jgi:protein-tyrosine phosphatase
MKYVSNKKNEFFFDSNQLKTSVLFVCMGNICRSPTAEVVFRSLVNKIDLQENIISNSAGTHSFHEGEKADERARKFALKRGYDLSYHQARSVQLTDFNDYDLILAMDWDNLGLLQRMAPRGTGHKLHLLMRYATNTEAATIPDPYDGSAKGFDVALNYIEDACEGLVETICRKASINAAA